MEFEHIKRSLLSDGYCHLVYLKYRFMQRQSIIPGLLVKPVIILSSSSPCPSLFHVVTEIPTPTMHLWIRILLPTIILAYTRSSCINKYHSYDCILTFHCHPTFLVITDIVMFSSFIKVKPGHLAWWCICSHYLWYSYLPRCCIRWYSTAHRGMLCIAVSRIRARSYTSNLT